MNTILDLSGIWEFKLDEEKVGINDESAVVFDDTITLPGSTSLAKKGKPNRNRETYFLTEVHKFEGHAWYRKKVKLPLRKSELKGKHFFLTLERTRVSYVWVDGEFAGVQDSFIAKHVYDLTGLIKTSSPVITVMVSNVDYVIGGGHMTSQDTQTNWNGILGEISLEICDSVRISNASTMCNYKNKQAIVLASIENFGKKTTKEDITVTAELCRLKPELMAVDSDCSIWEERATTQQAEKTDLAILDSYLEIKKNTVEALVQKTELTTGTNEVELVLQLPSNAKKWDEEEPWVYRIKIACGTSEKIVWFGLREFKAKKRHFTINGRKTFLRGRHQGMLFPLSGFAPMNVTGWLKDFKIVKDWGINHERCHTCTPPEAAFIAADLLGFYFQPELPLWGTWLGENDEKYSEAEVAQDFLTVEGFNILDEYAGHPSFVMMSMGNELWGSPEALNELVGSYKAIRPDIMFTQGSNNFQWIPNIQPNDDFFSGVRLTVNRQIRGSYAQCDAPLGRIQTMAPSTDWNYDLAIAPEIIKNNTVISDDGTVEIQYGTGVKRVQLTEAGQELMPEIPVVSHEIGQYFMYPDYDEIREYKGVLQARNLEIFQERLDDRSLYKRAKWYVRSSGDLAIASYKEELEAALRSGELAGFQMLDLQDFTGQGTALVGPLNSLMKNKGLIFPYEWRRFCAPTVVLGQFSSYVVDNGGSLDVTISIAHYSKKKIKNANIKLILIDKIGSKIAFESSIEVGKISDTGLFNYGTIKVEIPEGKIANSYRMIIEVTDEGEPLASNAYVLWSYPKARKNRVPKNVIVANNINEVMDSVDEGKAILFYLDPEKNRRSIPGAYCGDFWNYPMFRSISESMNKPVPVGTLGTLILRGHPALAGFPSESYTTPQWFDIIERSRVSNLNGIGLRPIVTVIDNCERNDNMGIIYEFEIMDGKNGPCHVLVCTSPLRKLIEEGNAPAATLEKSLLEYLNSGSYLCEVRTNASALKRLSN